LIPNIEFAVSKAVNEFCHISVLYREFMPAELATGMLDNKTYESRNSRLRHEELRLQLQKLRPFPSDLEWYEFATGLMKRSPLGGLEALSTKSGIVDLFQDIRQRRDFGFEEIWRDTRPGLEAYKEKFECEWSPIGDQVLTRLSSLAKRPWTTDRIRVHFIDCLYGGFGWNDCIGFAPFPDIEVQKKFLAHELSELITPRRSLVEALREAKLNLGIAHTVVDLLAYFSVRDFLAKPVFPNVEKKGIKPNPNYYPAVEGLYLMFERYAENPAIYQDFQGLVQDIVATLKEVSIIQ